MANNVDKIDVLTRNNDYDPVPGKQYFHPDGGSYTGCHRICMLIPMYNETTKELKRTLYDLYKCIKKLNKYVNHYVHILVIADGWKAMHPSVKQFIKELYPMVKDSLTQLDNPQEQVETYILQKIMRDQVADVKLDENTSLKLSFIIKLDNRRKHNSHGWFLQSFAPEMNTDFVFLTDCGTRFDKDCLNNLYRVISRDKRCSAISGRQRVMTAKQQESNDGLRGYMYRAMQRFDYEASLASYVGAFSIFGMLPVIPGPCGLYRFAAIYNKQKRQELLPTSSTLIYQNAHFEHDDSSMSDDFALTLPPTLPQNPQREPDVESTCTDNSTSSLSTGVYIDAVDFYIKTVSLNPDETGILLGSLLLAEDRILSYAAVLRTDEKYYTKYEPSACFYFEAETEPMHLLQQRRRWINGTFAGYLWLLQNIGMLLRSKINWVRKGFLTALVASQLMMFVVLSLGTAIITIAIRYPLMTALGLSRMYVEIIIGAYVLMYILFVYSHSSPKRQHPKLNVVLFDIMTIINVAVTALTVYAFIMDLMKSESIVNIGIVCSFVILPFLLAALHDLKSFFLMITSFIPFLMLLPTFTVTLSVYAFSRLWELTWGNRPSDKLLTIKKQKTEQELEEIKTSLDAHAQTICWFLVVLNCLFTAAFAIWQDYPLFITTLQCAIFVWPTVQMFFSIFYFIIHGIMQAVWILSKCCKHKTTETLPRTMAEVHSNISYQLSTDR